MRDSDNFSSEQLFNVMNILGMDMLLLTVPCFATRRQQPYNQLQYLINNHRLYRKVVLRVPQVLQALQVLQVVLLDKEALQMVAEMEALRMKKVHMEIPILVGHMEVPRMVRVELSFIPKVVPAVLPPHLVLRPALGLQAKIPRLNPMEVKRNRTVMPKEAARMKAVMGTATVMVMVTDVDADVVTVMEAEAEVEAAGVAASVLK